MQIVAAPQLKCPHCGSNAFQLLKGFDVLECLSCGRSSMFTVALAFAADEGADRRSSAATCHGILDAIERLQAQKPVEGEPVH